MPEDEEGYVPEDALLNPGKAKDEEEEAGGRYALLKEGGLPGLDGDEPAEREFTSIKLSIQPLNTVVNRPKMTACREGQCTNTAVLMITAANRAVPCCAMSACVKEAISQLEKWLDAAERRRWDLIANADILEDEQKRLRAEHPGYRVLTASELVALEKEHGNGMVGVGNLEKAGIDVIEEVVTTSAGSMERVILVRRTSDESKTPVVSMFERE